jgi:2-polyprenyl-3-methyl-5-hydroxy-6-metoxy-1,4-benzoquinol methylase
MCKDNSWSEQYKLRREAARRFGGIFDLPIIKRVREALLDCVRDDMRVLEVGAGDRRMGDLLRSQRANVDYRSMDIDPHGEHDYRSLDEIDGTFDCVFAFEVVEHIDVESLPGWLTSLTRLLAPGGRLVLSTPNTYYPPAYLRDVTHRTPLCYDELAALVASAGGRVVRINRVYHDPIHRKLMRRYLFGWLFRMIGIDFARQIVLVAEKPAALPA